MMALTHELTVPDGTPEECLRYIQAVREKCRQEHNSRGQVARLASIALVGEKAFAEAIESKKNIPAPLAAFRAWREAVWRPRKHTYKALLRNLLKVDTLKDMATVANLSSSLKEVDVKLLDGDYIVQVEHVTRADATADVAKLATIDLDVVFIEKVVEELRR